MKVSIITINFNNNIGLQKTIESVIDQIYKDYEYIIIDGGSTDGSKELIENYADKLTYWVSERDAGVYNAMNKGIKKATGEYCLFLNSGDWLVNKNILKEVFEDPVDVDIIYGNAETSNGTRIYPAKLTMSFFFVNTLCHQTSFIKTPLFKKFGYYNENYKIVSDWEFFVTALVKNNCSYQYINKIVSHYNLDGISSRKENEIIQITERKNVLKKIFSPIIYDDYVELRILTQELDFYKNSKAIQFIKKIQQSNFYKKMRGIV